MFCQQNKGLGIVKEMKRLIWARFENLEREKLLWFKDVNFIHHNSDLYSWDIKKNYLLIWARSEI